MSLPRRVPWVSLSQLEQVYSAIYVTKDWDFAIRRLSTWRYSTGLPHALDAALSLLVASRNEVNEHVCNLSIRQGYALAIIRFVNGLVDPLQTSKYARSIAMISSQIGLPLSLVELRHAATHEDLPSVEALREGAKLALSWIEQRYFTPALANNQQPLSTGPDPLRPLNPLLKQYKAAFKLVIKDVSLKKSMSSEITAILRAFDGWISEAATVAWSTWDSDEEERTSWALEKLCTALTQPGGLVPVAKRKQPNSIEEVDTTLWQPLLEYLRSSYHDFSPIFVESLVVTVLDPFEGSISTHEDTKRGDGYYYCLSGWLLWASAQWNDSISCNPESLVTLLFKDIPKDSTLPEHITALLDKLGYQHPHIQSMIQSFSKILTSVEVLAPLFYLVILI
ncbi:rRNA-processing protein las1 [Serendipita sp. 405]|nr:rRNA-processing protein las1 [Serendipita sp. 405]